MRLIGFFLGLLLPRGTFGSLLMLTALLFVLLLFVSFFREQVRQ